MITGIVTAAREAVIPVGDPQRPGIAVEGLGMLVLPLDVVRVALGQERHGAQRGVIGLRPAAGGREAPAGVLACKVALYFLYSCKGRRMPFS
jgi:hypothetical protein